MTPDDMLATVSAAGDTPRRGHIAAAYDLRTEALVVLGGDLANEGEIARRISRGSLNQREGYRAALYLLTPGQARRGLLVSLRRQLDELMESELLGSYSTINRGWVLADYLVSQRIGDREVYSLTTEIMRRVISVEKALECPSSSHPDLSWQCVSPGGRMGDRNGMVGDRDHARAIETLGGPLWKLGRGQRDVEVWMVYHAISSGRLPLLEPVPLSTIGTRWVLDIRYYQHGHEARFRSMERAEGAIDAVSVDYRMKPGPGGVGWRHGMAVESVGWDRLAERWKGSRPEGWNVPWQPGAPPLPERDLGRLVREVVIGEEASVDRPEPSEPSVPPAPPTPPTPPPSEPRDTDRYEARVKNVRTGQYTTILIGNDREGTLTIFREV